MRYQACRRLVDKGYDLQKMAFRALRDLLRNTMHQNIRNFTLSDNFIWTNLFDRVRLTNLDTGETWYYNDNDGILGKNIYKVGNNQDWVWFLSTDGVSLYNWRKYHVN